MKLIFNHVAVNGPPVTTVMNIENNTLYIYDYIGSYKWSEDDTTVTASDFVSQIRNMSGDITVRINSKGGEVGNALAIYQQLLEYPGKVTCVVDGYAYSSASWILLAGDERYINVGGLVMIHNPAMYAVIDSEDAVEKIMPQWRAHKNSIKSIITNRTDLDEDKVEEYMNAETFFSASEAVEYGFCNGIREGKNMIPDSVANSLPDDVKPKVKKPENNYKDLVIASNVAITKMLNRSIDKF